MNVNIFENIVNKVLQEYSADQRLPFDDDQFKNKNYLEQYTDWLEDFGKYGELPPSKLDFWDEVKKAIRHIIDNKLHGRFDLGIESYDENEMFNKVVKIIGNNLNITDDNKIYVERQVKINDNASNYDKSLKTGKDPKKLYNTLIKKYNSNVGGCWSYRNGGSYAYCSKDEGDIITLKGYIRTDDIDFVKTVLLNFHYPNEHEIRVKPNAKVELTNAVFNCIAVIPLKGHLIVNSTYFGNNKGYEGEYATVDDGFGKYSLIDRKNNILNNNLYFDEIDELNNGFAIVKLNNKYSFIDASGHLIDNGNLWFDMVFPFSNGCDSTVVCINENGNLKYSLLNKDGKLVKDGKLWFDIIFQFMPNTDTTIVMKIINGDRKFSLIKSNGDLVKNGKLWVDMINTLSNDGLIESVVGNERYYIDMEGNFYDYETKQPIPSPIDNSVNENKKYIKNIIKETINNYLKRNLM